MKVKPLKIISLGDERLYQPSLPGATYDQSLTDFIEKMFLSLTAKKGLGLAAVQVGRLLRVFIALAPEDGPRVFCNPEITATSEEQAEIEEGCLSVPKMYERVIRPARVTGRAL